MWLRTASRIAGQGIWVSAHDGGTRRCAVLQLICSGPKAACGTAIRYSAAGRTKQGVCVDRYLLCAKRNALHSASFRQLECLATEGTEVQRYPALKIGQRKSTLSISAVRRTDQLEQSLIL